MKRFCQGRKPVLVLGVNDPLPEGVKQREGDGSAEGPVVPVGRDAAHWATPAAGVLSYREKKQ